MNQSSVQVPSTVAICDPSKRQSIRKIGNVVLSAAALPMAGTFAPRPVMAAIWIAPTIGFVLGYGFAKLWEALKGSEQRYAQERLRDRMAGFDFTLRGNMNSLGLFLGQSGADTDVVSRLYWPEWGYHDAKIKEGAPYSHPVSPREGLAYSDKQIFEAAMGRRAPGLMNSGQAYARDYRDSKGNDLRVVAARLPDGQTYVAESNGRNATGYEVSALQG